MRCASGRHEWFEAKDAKKCCNGFTRVLVFPGDPLWSSPDRSAAVYDHESETWYARAWVQAPHGVDGLGLAHD